MSPSVNLELLTLALFGLSFLAGILWLGRLVINEMRLLREGIRGIEARLKGIEDTASGILRATRSSRSVSGSGSRKHD